MIIPESLPLSLQDGACAVIPTDTIYGIVTSALHKEGVERIYTIKGRSPEKPCIILLDSPERMRDFGVSDEWIEKVHDFKASGPTSFIVPITRTNLEYLVRNTQTLAFRIPQNEELHNLLMQTGPLIAPSANPEGFPPATTIDEARDYFGDKVDYFIDGGTIVGTPSVLIDLKTGKHLR